VPSRHDPAASLADIVENLERIEGYVAGLDREGFASVQFNQGFAGFEFLLDFFQRIFECLQETDFRQFPIRTQMSRAFV
jgi:uncharacterized protein with HEPN domain